MTITHRIINDHAWINNTFLAPYAGYTAKLTELKNGDQKLEVDGSVFYQIKGEYCTASNGWRYTFKKLLGKPLKKKS